MFIKLLLLFTVVPIIELALLIRLGSYIGIIYTILLVGLTGVIGVSLARGQGFKIINKVKNKLQQGIIPADDMIEGLLILIGGVLLLTPGLITDIAGFSLILPGSRHIVAKFIKLKFKKYIRKNHIKYKNFNHYNQENTNYENDYVDIESENNDHEND